MNRRKIRIVRKARVAACTRYGYVYWKSNKRSRYGKKQTHS